MELLYFGDNGWGDELAIATLMTIAVSITAMLIGFIFAALFTPLKLSKRKYFNLISNSYNSKITLFEAELISFFNHRICEPLERLINTIKC